MSQKVTQAHFEISVTEKEAANMDCVYENSGPNYSLLWYKQSPSGEMVFLVCQDSYNKDNTSEGRYSVNFQKSASSIELAITATQVEDSAVYFCALRDATVEEMSTGLPQKTQLEVEGLWRDSSTDRTRETGMRAV